MNSDKSIRLELTPKQIQEVKEACGREIPVIELQVEELEDRIAPASAGVHFKEVIITP